MENGKKMKTTMGRQSNLWLIAKRTSNFTWQEKRELAQ
jgi:hypothetical protein